MDDLVAVTVVIVCIAGLIATVARVIIDCRRHASQFVEPIPSDVTEWPVMIEELSPGVFKAVINAPGFHRYSVKVGLGGTEESALLDLRNKCVEYDAWRKEQTAWDRQKPAPKITTIELPKSR